MGCSCGNPEPFAECCEPLLQGTRAAGTAEALMRSRYSAYVAGDVDYIIDTQSPETRHTVDRQATADWSRRADWRGLEIVSTAAGGPGDVAGTVEFIARYAMNGEDVEHHEVAEFRRQDDRWYFVDGQPPKQEPFRRETQKVARQPMSKLVTHSKRPHGVSRRSRLRSTGARDR